MSEEVAQRIELLRRERAELVALLGDSDPSSDRTRAGVVKGFLREQIDALDKQIAALEREQRPY